MAVLRLVDELETTIMRMHTIENLFLRNAWINKGFAFKIANGNTLGRHFSKKSKKAIVKGHRKSNVTPKNIGYACNYRAVDKGVCKNY